MKSVCVDLDGTLAKYDGFKGIHHFGKPFPFAKEWTKDISKRYKIIIYTCRTNLEINKEEIPYEVEEKDHLSYLVNLVKDWLHKNDITYDTIFCGQGKPSCAYYIDDKAINVKNGIYPEI